MSRALRDELVEVGFRVEIDRVEPSELLRDAARFDLANGYAEILYPDTAAFVSGVVLGEPVPASWFSRTCVVKRSGWSA